MKSCDKKGTTKKTKYTKEKIAPQPFFVYFVFSWFFNLFSGICHASAGKIIPLVLPPSDFPIPAKATAPARPGSRAAPLRRTRASLRRRYG